jgi:hypothetical protein
MNVDQMIERISKNIGCNTETLQSKMDVVLSEYKGTWLDAGKTDEDCQVNALRIAGRQIKSEGEKLKRSGATLYEGMYVSVPRFKDWAELAYKKAAATLSSGNATVIEALIEEGNVTLFEDNNDGTYTKKYNPSLYQRVAFETGMSESEVESLPKGTYDAGNGLHFHLIWDKTNMTFPSGDNNFKYGAARPLSEKDRTCYFLGRKANTNDEVSLLSFRFNGALAEEQPPTFVTGTVAMRPARAGNVAYGKAGVSSFNRDDSLQSVFTDAPDQMVAGLDAFKTLEGGFQDIEAYVGTLDDKQRWDALAAVICEVVHIDPRDNGGFIITTGDLDIMSTAGTVDIYVPHTQSSLVDFSVGSTLMVVGSPYVSRDDEGKLAVTGWWCAESLAAPVASQEDGEGSWD